MKLPHFLPIKMIKELRQQNEKIFTEASELALLRLQGCIADLRIPDSTMRNAIQPLAASGVRKTHELPDSAPTTTKEIINSLRASSGQLMRVTFSDGVVQTVIIGTIDDYGFLHRNPDREDPQVFWTRFEDVDAIEAET